MFLELTRRLVAKWRIGDILESAKLQNSDDFFWKTAILILLLIVILFHLIKSHSKKIIFDCDDNDEFMCYLKVSNVLILKLCI